MLLLPGKYQESNSVFSPVTPFLLFSAGTVSLSDISYAFMKGISRQEFIVIAVIFPRSLERIATAEVRENNLST
jgi:hypothetical protein